MNVNDVFPSRYLKASDLGGRQLTLQIERVEFEPVGQTREMKAILYFEGQPKGMVLNKTNAKTIAALTGSFETDEWVGFRIRLYAANVEFQGEQMESLRVKAAPPTSKPAQPAPVTVPADEDIEFP